MIGNLKEKACDFIDFIKTVIFFNTVNFFKTDKLLQFTDNIIYDNNLLIITIC